MKNKTLLEKAKDLKIERGQGLKLAITDEDIELAVAWANGEVSGSQLCQVKGFNSIQKGNMYNYLLRALKQYAIKNSSKK